MRDKGKLVTWFTWIFQDDTPVCCENSLVLIIARQRDRKRRKKWMFSSWTSALGDRYCLLLSLLLRDSQASRIVYTRKWWHLNVEQSCKRKRMIIAAKACTLATSSVLFNFESLPSILRNFQNDAATVSPMLNEREKLYKSNCESESFQLATEYFG